MTQRRWFGDVIAFSIDPGIGESEIIHTVSLNSVNIHDGDTILRALCSWQMESDFVPAAPEAPLPFTIYKFGFNFQPPPFGEAQFDPGGAGGDSLCKDFTRWRRVEWTDGTSHASKWQADSGGVISVQGQRTIHDKTSDLIVLFVKQDNAANDITLFQSAKVFGWMWIEYLVQTNFA